MLDNSLGQESRANATIGRTGSWSESGRGQPHSKTLSRWFARRSVREVLECGCPLPLYSRASQGRFMASRLLAHLNHVIQECPVHIFEPMWNAIRNDDDIAFVQLMVF